jgi:hypothetical protein
MKFLDDCWPTIAAAAWAALFGFTGHYVLMTVWIVLAVILAGVPIERLSRRWLP